MIPVLFVLEGEIVLRPPLPGHEPGAGRDGADAVGDNR